MAFKPSTKRKKRNMEGGLNMNSMMDMVTIILLFLLKSYSTSGALKTNADDMKLQILIELLNLLNCKRLLSLIQLLC
jgi:hypothetical protein